MRRIIHAARYLSNPVYRRKISRQLNKGESLHALRRDLHYAQQGTIVRPHLQDQTEQAWCLTRLTNSVITWTTEYYGMGIGELRGQGRDIPDELLSFIAPATGRTSTSSALSASTSKPNSPSSSKGGGRCAPPLSPSPAPQIIPGKFLETILTHLRRSNVVRSKRDPNGGFWLARPASEISLADVIRAVGLGPARHVKPVGGRAARSRTRPGRARGPGRSRSRSTGGASSGWRAGS